MTDISETAINVRMNNLAYKDTDIKINMKGCKMVEKILSDIFCEKVKMTK